MANIKPFRAWRYSPMLEGSLDELVSPLYDDIPEKQRESLYKNPYNAIHLSGFQQTNPTHKLDQWKQKNIIIQDQTPALYVYYQYFTLFGAGKEYCRKGFIGNVRIYEWEDRIIRRHEDTIPYWVNDRAELLNQTLLQSSPIHGLYTDQSAELEGYMDKAIEKPLYNFEDYQGVHNVLAVIEDPKVIQKFINKLNPLSIILADGHHRYEGSLQVKHKRMRENLHHTGREGYNYHMMYLTNTHHSEGLHVLPTHRVIKGFPDFHEEEIMQRVQHYFTVEPVEKKEILHNAIIEKKWAFVLIFKNRSYKIMLKPEFRVSMSITLPDVIKDLDVTILHYFIIDKAIGILMSDQPQSPYLFFDRNYSDCFLQVNQGLAQMAIITNGVNIDQVRQVCDGGYLMPQKSTFFYPKAICGYLFNSIKEEEFQQEEDTLF